jgi:hypothetical protein
MRREGGGLAGWNRKEGPPTGGPLRSGKRQASGELDTRIRSRKRKFEAKGVDSNARLGLAHDVGLGCEPVADAQASQFKLILTTANGLVTYLLRHGADIRDGDTIGKSEDERVPVRLMDSQRFIGLPVIAASLTTR